MRARCSKPAPRASSASIAIRRRSPRRATRWRPGPIASSSCTPTTASSTTCSTAAASASIDGALADLGVSSMQLEAPGRGFSFQRDEPLDMRMDPTPGETAAELVARASERDLADAIFAYGEERFSRRIARVDRRRAARSADRDDRAPGGDRAARGAAPRLHAHRSGDADVSGAAHLGEPRARRTRSLHRGRGPPAAGRRAARGDHVSLARRSHRQAHAARARSAASRPLVKVLTKKPVVAERRRSAQQSARAQRQAARRRAGGMRMASNG